MNNCNYSCEKLYTLKKHKQSMHTDQKCKLCSKDFKPAIDLVVHVSNEHHEEEGEWNFNCHSTPKADKEGKKQALYLVSQ